MCWHNIDICAIITRMFYIAAFLFVVAVIVWWFTRSSTDSDVKRFGQYGSAIALSIAIVLTLLSSFRIVPAGSVGVKVLFGTVDSKPIYSGLHIVNPLCSIVTVPVRTMEYTMVARSAEGAVKGDDSVPLFTKDTMRLNADVTVIYRVNPDSVPWLYRTIGNQEDFERKVIRPSSRSAFRQGALKIHNA